MWADWYTGLISASLVSHTLCSLRCVRHPRRGSGSLIWVPNLLRWRVYDQENSRCYEWRSGFIDCGRVAAGRRT